MLILPIRQKYRSLLTSSDTKISRKSRNFLKLRFFYIGSHVFEPNNVHKSINIRGIEITQSVCDIIAMEAPVFVSPPNAAGKTTVLSPSGVPKAKNASVIT